MKTDPYLTWWDAGWWTMPTGVKRLLSWNAGTHELSLIPIGREAPIVLAVIADEDDVRRRLAGWQEHCDTKEGLEWLAQQLEGSQ